MPVTEQTPFNESTANGVATVFPYTFKLLDEDDLKVYADDVLVASGYTVSGIGAAGGGNVTFSVAPANGVVILLRREIALVRATDYQDAGDFLAETIDTDFDRIWQVLQEIAQDVTRSIKTRFSTTTDQTLAADAAARANKALIFDASGNVTLSADDYDDQAANASASAAAAAASASSASSSASSASSSASAASASAAAAAASAASVDAANLLTKSGNLTGLSDASAARANLGLGTAATKNTGTASGNVPLVGTASATETLAGLVELATTAEVDSGAANVVPDAAKVKAALPIKQVVESASGAVASGSATIPNDDTIPQITEGTQFLSASITPTNASNILHVEAVVYLSGATSGRMQAALFKGSDADAIAAGMTLASAVNFIVPVVLSVRIAAGTTSPITFSLRAGADSGNCTLNGTSGTRVFGGAMASWIRITEVKP